MISPETINGWKKLAEKTLEGANIMITPEERKRLRELRLSGHDDYIARKVYQATAIDKFHALLDAACAKVCRHTR